MTNEIAAIDTTTTADAIALEAQARLLAITGPADYANAAEFLLGIKALRSRIEATFDPHIKRAFDAHRALCAEKRGAEAALVVAERIAKDVIVAWDSAQERARLDEQRRLDAIAASVVAERALDAAIVAIDAGDVGRAEQILELSSAHAPAAVPSTVPKIDGINFRDTWSARVTDFAALVQGAVDNPQWLGLLKPDTAAINGLARSLRGRLRVPGVEAICTRDVAGRR